VKNPSYSGDLLSDIVTHEEKWFNTAVAQWKEKVSELVSRYGSNIAASGEHKTTLEELLKKVHRDIWTTNRGAIYDVDDMLLLVDAGLMFLRKDCYELVEKVVVLAICQHFDQIGNDLSKDHILQHYLRDMMQSSSHGARAEYDCSWEFFTARLFMLHLSNPESYLWEILVRADATLRHYTFKGRFCVSSRIGLKAYDYIEMLISTTQYDDTMYLADNFAGGDLFWSLIRKTDAPLDLPKKRIGITQVKALTAATLSGKDYERALATTQIDQQYTAKRAGDEEELVDSELGAATSKKRKLLPGTKSILSEDRQKMIEVTERYPDLVPWSIGILTIAGKVSTSTPVEVKGHRIRLQLGLFDGESHHGLGLWKHAQETLLAKFNVLESYNKSRAKFLYSFACDEEKRHEERKSAIAQIVHNCLQDHLLQPELGDLLGFLCETKKKNGERREDQMKRFLLAAQSKTRVTTDILATQPK
jgi:ElaB/YqjD/DUF883 family membrane-anchored ribosome-binding protein